MARFSTAIFFAAISLTLASVAGRAAQPAQLSPAARRSVILPAKLVAGAPATLAVLDAGGQLVPGATVEISGGGPVTTDSTGRAAFIAPAEAGVLTVHLKEDGSIFTAAVISAPPKSKESAQASAPVEGVPSLAFPTIAALGSSFTLNGEGFRGDARQDRVLLGEKPAFVLAASPISLAILPNPDTVLGPAQFSVEAAGRSLAKGSVNVVSVAVAGPSAPLAAGQNGTLLVRVTGSTDRLAIEVRNLSPDVVALPHGVAGQFMTSGGASNVAQITLTGVRPGDYSVSARIVH